MKRNSIYISSRALALALALTGAGLPVVAAAQAAPAAGDFADDAITYGAGAPATVASAAAMPQVGAGLAGVNSDAANAVAMPSTQDAASAAPMPVPDATTNASEGASGGGGEQPMPAATDTKAPQRRIIITPYIEVGQVFYAGLNGGGIGNNSGTYSTAAAGVDALFNGRNTQGAVSLRYERVIGYGSQPSADLLSGVARMSTAVVPGVLKIDYGAFADRAYINQSGAALPNASFNNNSLNQIWSVFAGPTLSTHVGALDVGAHYRFGFTQEGGPVGNPSVGQGSSPDSFARARVHDAGAEVGFKPGTVLPVGLGAEGGYYFEDDSLLGQHIKNEHVRGVVTVPVSPTLQLVGGAGVEKVQVSSYNAVLDASGNPVLDGQGHYISDSSQPRLIAFDTSGLIWDVGVVWRPSPRTALDMHFGRRYGAYGAWGSFSWTPSERNAVNVTVYDNLVGFGGDLTDALAGSPTAFTAVRDPISGNLSSCVATSQGGGCIASVLGAVNGLVYRDRGGVVQYSHNFGHVHAGLAAGYDNREYVGAAGSVLAGVNGAHDQYYWVAAYATAELSPRSTLSDSVDVYRFESGLGSTGASTGIHASGTYQYRFTRHLTASATLAVDGINSESLDSIWAVSGALALRYSF